MICTVLSLNCEQIFMFDRFIQFASMSFQRIAIETVHSHIVARYKISIYTCHTTNFASRSVNVGLYTLETSEVFILGFFFASGSYCIISIELVYEYFV